MNIITQSVVNNLNDSDIVSGVVLIKDYKSGVTKKGAGSPFIDGQFGVGNLGFKIWTSPNGLVEKFKSGDYRGKICEIHGTCQVYNGVKSVIVTRCEEVAEEVDRGLFLPVKYNKDAFIEALQNILVDKLSPEGVKLINAMLFDNEPVFSRFVSEFCAKSHHDNCLNGLLVHSYKVLDLVCFMVSRYGVLSTFPSRELPVVSHRTDLLYIGSLIHDWGKIREMQYGVYQPNSAVTHRFFGTEMLAPFKDMIVATYDEKWYYDLVSIITQHHGEFGEDCQTLPAYIVHLADMLDTQLTGLSETVDCNLNSDASGSFVYHADKRLSL
jgi:3'-5' exoribonuclease